MLWSTANTSCPSSARCFTIPNSDQTIPFWWLGLVVYDKWKVMWMRKSHNLMSTYILSILSGVSILVGVSTTFQGANFPRTGCMNPASILRFHATLQRNFSGSIALYLESKLRYSVGSEHRGFTLPEVPVRYLRSRGQISMNARQRPSWDRHQIV